MTKIVEITSCTQCPHFDDFYYSYRQECLLLHRRMEKYCTEDYDYNAPIPDDCPLPDKETK